MSKGEARGSSKPFTEEMQRVFLQLVAAGEYPSAAAMHVGVTHQCISKRKKTDPAFRAALNKAIASYRFGLVAVVTKGAQKDPKLALEVLARRWPNQWAKAVDRVAMAAIEKGAKTAGGVVEAFSEAMQSLPIPDFADGYRPKPGSVEAPAPPADSGGTVQTEGNGS